MLQARCLPRPPGGSRLMRRPRFGPPRSTQLEVPVSRIMRLFPLFLLALVVSLVCFTSFAQEKPSADKPDFDITASYIEACSCDMFCPCYFNTHSTNHMGMGEHHMEEHFCRANLVLKVDKGYYKVTKLDGAKVWLGSDLGSDWSTGKDSWIVMNFDPSVSKEQQAALTDILTQLYSAIPFQKKAVSNTAFSWDVDSKTGVAPPHKKHDQGGDLTEEDKGRNHPHQHATP